METTAPTSPVELLDIEASRAFCGNISRNHFYDLIRQGVMPKPIKLSLQCSRWIRSELEAAVAKLAAKRTTNTQAQNG